MEVHVIRHTPVGIHKDICYGQSELPLADTFLEDIDRYRKELPHDIDIIFSSPSTRCTTLATAIDATIVVKENALLEINFGDWENKKWSDLPPDALHAWMENFVETKTPNGENLIEVFDRVKTFFDELRAKDYKKVLIVSHAGVIRCIWSYLLQIPLDQIFKIPVGYNEQFIFQLSKNATFDSIISTK